ncbi:flagellar motor switch protein FliG [Roseovarius sp. A46]|uniref:flagellar motor switch protein FliG n=1 Tax=Roseovarius sp. A46 TaxID=2109331 RepID=UPI001013B8EE|nr:FliG C-terminal domain-containing protein [Roseovarius sp. A46]RXV63934.1 flagellar motor switch protein FliG [Roseovarius sp. A46]
MNAPPARIEGPRPRGAAAHLSRAQKAAIIVRFLMNEGADVSLSDLPDELQGRLTTQMGSMRYVDRGTLADVVAKFANELEGMGLTFPRGLPGALSALDGRISPQTAARLRKEAGVRQYGDPWELVKATDPETLVPILEAESAEVAAVILSKLDVARAADLLGRLPGAAARRITYAISQTGSVSPEAVDRIGLALAAQIQDVPQSAFADGAVERVGAILNYSAAIIRDEVLEGLEDTDEDFAALVRRAIFTFLHLPDRVNPTDIPRILREVDQPVQVAALAGALDGALAPVAEFLLSNMSKRMADALREEIAERGRVRPREAEAAQTEIVNAVRRLEAAGEISLLQPDEDGDGGG